MTAGLAPWHNLDLPTDVNGDQVTSPIDALLVVNDLVENGPRPLTASNVDGVPTAEGESPHYFVDVNQDDHASPSDVLRVINELNAEGERGGVVTLGDFAQELKDQGVRLFGTDSCYHCIRQKEMFGADQDKLPYIRVEDLASNPSLNPTGHPIVATPTWEFQDLHRVEGMLTLRELSDHSGIPLPPEIIHFNTNLLDFDVRLLFSEAPNTVDNFLNYVNDGDYDSSFFHRYMPGFVLQGGGYQTTAVEFTSTAQFSVIPDDPPIPNEFNVSNTAGTFGMAKLGGDPDSATSHWFLNLADNSTNLDVQNGGFTVFAELMDLLLINDIAGGLGTRDEGGAFTDLPVFGDPEQLVVIESIEGSGTVRGVQFDDRNVNGIRDAGEPGISGAKVFSDANSNGQLDDDELFATTVADGTYSLTLPQGLHSLRAEVPNSSLQTLPTSPDSYSASVEIGRIATGVDFGAVIVFVPTPASVDLAAATDSGISNSDNLTNFNNTTAEKALQFRVTGVQPGAVVRVYAGDVEIAQGAAAGNSILLTGNASNPFLDGTYSIVATQELNGVEGPPTAALEITIDSRAPEFTSVPPTMVIVGETLTYDAESADEATSTVTYSLDSAPTGAAINPATGTLVWQPTANQAGQHDFAILAADDAGNVGQQPLTIAVEKVKQVTARLEITDAVGQPTSEIEVGDTFILNAFVKDLREEANGVFVFYEDIVFDGNRATATHISHGVDFGNGVSGTIVPGLLDEIGSFSGSIDFTDDAERLLFSVEFTADSVGLVTFVGDPADILPAHEVALYDEELPTPPDEIEFGEVSLTITSKLEPNNDIFNLDEDSTTTVLDVLANDEFQTETGEATIARIGPTSGGGTVDISGDRKNLSYTPRANFVGEDTFTYTLTDGGGREATAEVVVQVFNVPDPPTAADDNYRVEENSTGNVFEVLDNDTTVPDPNETLEVLSVSASEQGSTLAVSEDGQSVIYSAPGNDFTGTDSFTYTIEDSNGDTAQATVYVEVVESSGLPIAGSVYIDSDLNGVRDEGELPISGVEIRLSDAGTGEVVAVTTTGAEGGYVFPAIPAGEYVITEIQPSFFRDGYESMEGISVPGSNLEGNANNDRFSVSLVDGAIADYDFGEFGLLPTGVAMREFLASTPRERILMATDSHGNLLWYQLGRQGWDGFQQVHMEFHESVSTMHVTVVDAAGNFFARDFFVPGSNVRRYEVGDGSYLIAILGSFDSLGFADFPS